MPGLAHNCRWHRIHEGTVSSFAFAYRGAKVRISENNTKQKTILFLLSSESTFGDAKGTQKIAEKRLWMHFSDSFNSWVLWRYPRPRQWISCRLLKASGYVFPTASGSPLSRSYLDAEPGPSVSYPWFQGFRRYGWQWPPIIRFAAYSLGICLFLSRQLLCLFTLFLLITSRNCWTSSWLLL